VLKTESIFSMARKLPEAEIFIQIRPQLFELACAYTHTHTAAKTKLSPLSTVRMNQQAMREAATICPHPLRVDLWHFGLESGVRVTCDVGYLSANFSLPRPLCSRLRPDVRDRQTDVRHTSSLNAPI